MHSASPSIKKILSKTLLVGWILLPNFVFANDPPAPPVGTTIAPATTATTAAAADAGRVRRTLSACVRWFNFPARARAQYAEFNLAANRPIREYFPNHATEIVDRNGRVVVYTEEEVKAFRKAVDLYFDFQIGPQNLDGLREFRNWLKETFGSPYPPLNAADIQTWIRDNPQITLIQVMRSFYDRFVQAKFTLPDDATTAQTAQQYTALGVASRVGTGARNFGKWFGQNVRATLKFVAFGSFVSVGTMGFSGALPEWVRTAPTQAQSATRDLVTGRTALHDTYRDFYRIIEESHRQLYQSSEADLERWAVFENNLYISLVAISREAHKFRERIPIPKFIKDLNVELRLRFDRNASDLERANTALIQLRRDTAAARERHGFDHDTTKDFVRQLSAQEALVRNLQLARVNFLAEWKLNNLILRANNAGSGPDASPDPNLDSENILINQEIGRIQQQGFLSHFTNAVNTLTRRFKEELKRDGYGN